MMRRIPPGRRDAMRSGARGQILPLAALSLVFVTVILIAMVDLAAVQARRIRTTNICDSATLAAGEALAQSMNQISTLNVSLAMMLSTIGVLDSFHQAVNQGADRAAAEVSKHCRSISDPLCARYRSELMALRLLQGESLPRVLHQREHLIVAMRAIHERELELAALTSKEAEEVFSRQASSERVIHQSFSSARERVGAPPRLPLEPAPRAALCEPGEHGRFGGYDHGAADRWLNATNRMPVGRILEVLPRVAARFNRGASGPWPGPELWQHYRLLLSERAPLSTGDGELLARARLQVWASLCGERDPASGPLLLSRSRGATLTYFGELRRSMTLLPVLFWLERSGSRDATEVVATAVVKLVNPFRTASLEATTGDGPAPGSETGSFTPRWTAWLIPSDELEQPPPGHGRDSIAKPANLNHVSREVYHE